MLAKTPLGLVGIVLVPLLLLAGLEIRRIWRPHEAETDCLGSGAHSAGS